jgi:serine protease Do
MLRHGQNLVRCLALVLAALVPLAGEATDRSHPKVLAAFRDVISQPAKSTVQVYCDGYRAALGVVVRPDGHIATKASELKGRIEVQLHDGRKLEANQIAADKEADLAILKISVKDLPVIAWNEGAAPAVGSWLVTPGLMRDPVAIGVLSVGPRKIAAPSGALGIQLDNDDSVARIARVVEEMAAAKAGIKEKDVIRKVNGKEIRSRQQLQETIRKYQPGDKVELVIEREGNELTLHATLGSFSQLLNGERAEFQNNLGGPLSERRAGFPLVIQHDSVLRPADCGGPLVDLDGKAIGLNIARAGRVESYALPAAVAREVIDKLLQTQLTSTPADEKAVDKAPSGRDR